MLCSSLRISDQLPAPIVNGGGDRFWKWKEFKLSRARDLDLGSGHTAYRRALLIDLHLHTKFRWDRRKNFFESHHWDFSQVQSHVTQKKNGVPQPITEVEGRCPAFPTIWPLIKVSTQWLKYCWFLSILRFWFRCVQRFLPISQQKKCK